MDYAKAIAYFTKHFFVNGTRFQGGIGSTILIRSSLAMQTWNQP